MYPNLTFYFPRLTTYQDNWPKIEKWYTRFGSLKTIDATLPKLTVYLEVENIMDETLQMVRAQMSELLPLMAGIILFGNKIQPCLVPFNLNVYFT